MVGEAGAVGGGVQWRCVEVVWRDFACGELASSGVYALREPCVVHSLSAACVVCTRCTGTVCGDRRCGSGRWRRAVVVYRGCQVGVDVRCVASSDVHVLHEYYGVYALSTRVQCEWHVQCVQR